MTDYYDLLGVSRDATSDEIKKAYRKKARQLHPDYAGPESEDAFKEATNAYEVLYDADKRRAYDMGGPDAVRGNGGGGYANADFGFSDLFETMFGSMGGFSPSNGPASRSRRGQDSLVAIEMTLEEITFGVTKEIQIETAVQCQICNGTCCEPGTSPVTCSVCGGSGAVSRIQQSLLGAIRTSAPCQACQGNGQTIPSPCHECGGQGRVNSQRKISIEVPAGVDNGTRIRLSEHGEVGPGGGPAGDLYVEVREKRHDVFSRSGSDLHTRINVPMTLAALGTVFMLETFDGEKEVVISPGTQPEEEIVLKGLGIGKLRGYGRGNLFVHIGLQTPDKLDDRQRELLQELADLRGEHRVEPSLNHSGGPFKWFKEKMAGQ